MAQNILNAITNIVNNLIVEIKEEYSNKNRINSTGDALEEYVKDLFAGTFNETNVQERLAKLSSTFSYLGNSSNPPDLILKNGDAIEVKKIETYGNALALNSSYPKHKLYSHSTLINDKCRNCEETLWEYKDIIYTVGVVKKGILSDMCMVYGTDYAADSMIYENIFNRLKIGITNIEGLELVETNEIARLNKVDPLGITNLRVRGMWHIENPFKVFHYVYRKNTANNFNFMAIINLDKYNSFPLQDRQNIEQLSKENDNFIITQLNIKSPNNPANLVPVMLFHFSV